MVELGVSFYSQIKYFTVIHAPPSPKLTHLLACYYIETCSDCSRNVVVYTNTTCILDFQGVTELNRVTSNIHFAFHKGFVSFAFEFY